MAIPLRGPIRVPTYTTDDLRRVPPDGQRYELLDGLDGNGSYVTAWRKEGGTWKISAYMWNLPEGPPRPDSTGAGR